MEEILRMIVENIVSDKEKISIEKDEKDDTISFKVKVAKDDMGRVIGKNGKIANSIRAIIKAMGTKEKKNVVIGFEEL